LKAVVNQQSTKWSGREGAGVLVSIDRMDPCKTVAMHQSTKGRRRGRRRRSIELKTVVNQQSTKWSRREEGGVCVDRSDGSVQDGGNAPINQRKKERKKETIDLNEVS
jgi:hypothetical protein